MEPPGNTLILENHNSGVPGNESLVRMTVGNTAVFTEREAMMNRRIHDLIEGFEGNYILPFFWQHGADESTLREYMGKIRETGIREVCLEARPHPDFVGPKWWQDVDVVMDEARKKGMRVWILDDSHFPTGFANGAVKDAPDHLKRWYLREKTMSVQGPLTGNSFEVASSLGLLFKHGPFAPPEESPEEIVAVILARREEDGDTFRYTECVNVTESVKDGYLRTDIPEGHFDILTYTKQIGVADKASDYISFLEKDSVRILIDTVYEPHYARYSSDFGTVFAGFFSDEPGFYNTMGGGFAIGHIGDSMPLPWADNVRDELISRTGDEKLTFLPALFHSLGGNERPVRFAYMDIVTRRYEENFSKQLGDWCEERGVEYIGHVLEDMDLHSSLGPGTGHYYRAMAGQHMSGIDTVLNQLKPDADYDREGRYYHYTLARLAASSAHQLDRHKGRALCEIFGAYGWSEGLTYMKWMADHMLVNGINRFTPHAFSEAKFPDPDCPPHFYAGGNNPQYRHMHVLYNGMNRAAHLLSGGRSPVDTAVLFSAEAEWTGGFRLPEELGRELMTHQIPYEIISMDILRTASVREGRIEIGTASYRHLVVDSQEYLPEDYLGTLAELESKGAEILFLNTVTKDFSGRPYPDARLIHDRDAAEIFSSGRTVCTDVPSYWLRAYRYDHADLTVYMLQNSSMLHTLEVNVTLPRELGKTVLYYPLENRFERPVRQESGALHFDFGRGESVMVLTGDDLPEGRQTVNKDAVWETLPDDYRISLAAFDAPDAFSEIPERQLQDILSVKKDFAGIIRYETMFYGKRSLLSLGECQEGAEVFINGNSAGVRISYPYRYDISGLTIEGENRLCIEVATTLFGAVRDRLSLQRPVPPAGVLGPVQVS